MYWHGLYFSFKASIYRHTLLRHYWELMVGSVYYAGAAEAQNPWSHVKLSQNCLAYGLMDMVPLLSPLQQRPIQIQEWATGTTDA